MANADSIFGCRWIGHLYGASMSGSVRPYTVPATDATALYVGDIVKTNGTSSADKQGVIRPEAIQAAAGDTPVGFVVGFNADPSYLNQIYRTASTLRTIYVCDDPYAIFEIQSDTSAALAAGDIGLNADAVVGTASTVTGLSGMELDHSTVATTNTLVLRILGLSPRADNELGINAKALCMFNLHRYKSTTGA